MRLLSVADIRQLECSEEASPGLLMARAGKSAADILTTRLHFPHLSYYILIGPGHNGGDGLLCGYWLAQRGYAVSLYSPQDNLTWKNSATPEIETWIAEQNIHRTLPKALAANTILVDALFGIGFMKRHEPNRYQDALHFLQQNRETQTIVSLDVPSGLDADTGVPQDPNTVQAHITVTFIAPKPGLFTGAGKRYAGEIICAALGLDEAIARHLSHPFLQTNGPAVYEPLPETRAWESHKGTHGNVLVIGGTEGMLGAPLLSARAAIHVGIGKCFLHYADPACPYTLDPLYPEILISNSKKRFFAEDFMHQIDSFAIGPGLGTLSYIATPLIKTVLTQPAPCLLDADALNILSTDHALSTLCAAREAPTILTPHPKEAAALLSCSLQSIQDNRIAAAQALSGRYQAYVVLKGAGSIIAAPDGRCVINTTGSPNLATGGSGDILTGIIAAMMTEYRHHPPFSALCYAVDQHGRTSDRLYADGYEHGLPSHVFLAHFKHARGSASIRRTSQTQYSDCHQQPTIYTAS